MTRCEQKECDVGLMTVEGMYTLPKNNYINELLGSVRALLIHCDASTVDPNKTLNFFLKKSPNSFIITFRMKYKLNVFI